ncbi:nitrogen permease reactivator protein [Sodiomyces alkalinus F11]|uniref:non-specific serine/threonine protein kinase n=1 Tax=Sodiomyces alkalinus (strain CBS 110278 / VKM F-3762 / F11) TaxID=1314773 RepID=A0A3N2Q1K2_SODAK|nr:nitrogen permease reactivator protein [Sodiomyces alkalinus F11]ROT40641.1 nitrogen permease reactivator protein [Sodiomyces alkalinus F11]
MATPGLNGVPQEYETHDPEKPSITESLASKDDTTTAPSDANPAVRFASTVEEISPAPAPIAAETNPHSNDDTGDAIDEAMQDQLRELSTTLRSSELQVRRLSRFAFEPYSLPATRVPSREDESTSSSRMPTPNRGSPHLRPAQQMQSPPLTPSAGDSHESEPKAVARHQSPGKVAAAGLEPPIITPQTSTSNDPSSPSANRGTPRSASSDRMPAVPRTSGERDPDRRPHRRGLFDIGPGSTPVSRESSPSRAAHFYSKPITPQGDANDPYAANKREPRRAYVDRRSIEPRFQFNLNKRPLSQGSPSSSTTNLSLKSDKRHSGLFGSRRNLGDEAQDKESSGGHSRQSSFADLKRFFKRSGQPKSKHDKPEASPHPSHSSGALKTPPNPFGDDHGLSARYGKLGKVLGSGAGGKVTLMKRHEDGVVFAVKEFNQKGQYESSKRYVKRLTAEFCVGSTLHHGNIIETLDIIQEKDTWYQVMEYAPYDLFAIVMTGKMSRAEITCCFLQILNGVTYLHSVGLAHRDLKLDNIVVSDKGIMKIIDFGSAHVFRYPFETGHILATGIVGSDPYLAPEVLSGEPYDAEAVDIWSLAIIFCCLSLRRFPWKVPKMTDNSFRMFAAEPTPGHDPKKLTIPSHSTSDVANGVTKDSVSAGDGHASKRQGEKWSDGRHSRHASQTGVPDKNANTPDAKTGAPPQEDGNGVTEEKKRESTSLPKTSGPGQERRSATAPTSSSNTPGPDKKEVIRGPWRVLRLLPRESRYIIGRMLAINPKDRAKMQEIVQDAWVANSEICQQFGPGGEVKLAEGHTHILESPALADKQPKK